MTTLAAWCNRDPNPLVDNLCLNVGLGRDEPTVQLTSEAPETETRSNPSNEETKP
jgi:hypothetical protein